jgi:purine-binding chemotaxis protein CheW
MTTATAHSEPYILLELAGTTYGVPSRLVQQMEMLDQLTPVPNAPDFVAGIVFSRGQVVPAVSLRRRFGLEPIAYDLRTRLIVVRSGRAVGLIVDAAREFVAVPADAIQPPPEGLAGRSGKYLQGIAILGDRLVLLLDVDELLNVTDELPATPVLNTP